MGINLENIQATRRAEVKDAELQREVEVKRAQMELERMRAYVYSELMFLCLWDCSEFFPEKDMLTQSLSLELKSSRQLVDHPPCRPPVL